MLSNNAGSSSGGPCVGRIRYAAYGTECLLLAEVRRLPEAYRRCSVFDHHITPTHNRQINSQQED